MSSGFVKQNGERSFVVYKKKGESNDGNNLLPCSEPKTFFLKDFMSEY